MFRVLQLLEMIALKTEKRQYTTKKYVVKLQIL